MIERHPTDQSKTAWAYRLLKQRLLFQEIPAQTKLDISVLARHLNVSRTPVREALILLANERIIQAIPGNGFFSQSLSVADITDDYEVAFVMLAHMIQANVQRFSSKDPAAPKISRSAMQSEPSAADIEPYARFIETLFEYIAAASGNRLALDLIRTFCGRTTFIRRLDLQQSGRLQEIAIDMSQLIDSLDRGDASAAVANLETQYRKKLSRLQELVAQANLRAINANESWHDLLR